MIEQMPTVKTTNIGHFLDAIRYRFDIFLPLSSIMIETFDIDASLSLHIETDKEAYMKSAGD